MNEHIPSCHAAGTGSGITPGTAAENLPPFSPLGWPVWTRLGAALAACSLLWAVVLWALD